MTVFCYGWSDMRATVMNNAYSIAQIFVKTVCHFANVNRDGITVSMVYIVYLERGLRLKAFKWVDRVDRAAVIFRPGS